VLGHLRRVRRRIDRHERVASFDQRAFAEVNGDDLPGDARAKVDPFDRFEPTRELIPGVGFMRFDGRDRHGHG
jgi:hypothetical protein